MTAPSDPTALVAELDREVEREAERIAESVLRRAPLFLEKVAGDLYEMLLRDVQAYLRDNAAFNIQSELSSLRASLQAERERSAQQAATIEAVSKHARAMSDALLKVRPLGGSELFSRVGEEFYADPKFCGDEIEKLRTERSEAVKESVRSKRALTAAEAERDRLKAEVAALPVECSQAATTYLRDLGEYGWANIAEGVRGAISDAIRARAALSTAKERGE